MVDCFSYLRTELERLDGLAVTVEAMEQQRREEQERANEKARQEGLEREKGRTFKRSCYRILIALMPAEQVSGAINNSTIDSAFGIPVSMADSIAPSATTAAINASGFGVPAGTQASSECLLACSRYA